LIKFENSLKVVEKGIIYLLTGFGIILLLFTLFHPPLLWDEVVFLSNAKAVIGESNYVENFRPPLLPLLIGSVWRITGKDIIIAKLLVASFSLFSLYMFYLIAKLYLRRQYAILSTFLLASSHLFLYWAFRVYTDIPHLFFILFSFYLFRRKKYFLSGIAICLGFLTRFTAAIFGFSMFLYFIFYRKFRELRSFLAGFIILVPWLTYNLIMYGNPIYDFYMDYVLSSSWSAPYREPEIKVVENLMNAMNFMLPFLLLSIPQLNKEENFCILSYLLLSIIFMLIMNLKDPRYLLMILPFLYLLSSQGISSLEQRKVAVPFIGLFIAFSTFQIIRALENEGKCWQSTWEAIVYISDRATENDTIISNFWPYFGFFTKSKVFSNYDELGNLIRYHHPSFLVFREDERMPRPEVIGIVNEKVIEGICSNVWIYEIENSSLIYEA